MKLARLLLFLICVRAAHAIGPTLPLEFEADRFTARTWSAAIRVDLNVVAAPKVTREIYQSGERVSGEQLRLKSTTAAAYVDRTPRLELPLRSASTTRLKPGIYAQRITVESAWRDKNNTRPLHIERWYYFQVRGKEIIRLSPEEYEKLTDLPQKNEPARGAIGRSYVGGDQAEVTPLSKTARSPAIRADSIATVSEEHPPQSAAAYQQQNEKPDRSEEKEP